MAKYPDLGDLSDDSGIGELLALPNASFPFYWGLMMVSIWIIITLSMYFREKEEGKIRVSLLSSMAVSSFAIIMLSAVGTLFKIITLVTFLPLLIAGLVIIAVWIFSN